MTIRSIFWSAVVAGGLGLVGMLAVILVWTAIPQRTAPQEVSPMRTDVFSSEIGGPGHSYFAKPEPKGTADWVRDSTPILWFGGLGTVLLAAIVGVTAWFRMNRDQGLRTAGLSRNAL